MSSWWGLSTNFSPLQPTVTSSSPDSIQQTNWNVWPDQQLPPFASKVKVYHWEVNNNQKHICTSITQKAREDCFNVYRYQFFYDLRYNEWDCSTDFGDYNNDNDDDVNTTFDYMQPQIPLANKDTQNASTASTMAHDAMPVDTKPSDSIPINTAAADIEPSNPIPIDLAPSTAASNVAGSASTPLPSNKDEGASSEIATPADLLQSHYGFLPAFVQSLHLSGSCPITDKDWNTILFSLRYRKDRHAQPSFAGAMYDFVTNIKIKNDMDSTLEGPPTVIHDLAKGSSAPLALT